MAETRSANINQLKADLAQNYGTAHLYRHFFMKRFVYTDGTKDYMEKAGAYWLMDILATEFMKPIMEKEPDVHYLKMIVNDKSQATITLDDYNGEKLYSKDIGFTDHVEGEINFILGWDGERVTWCLTSEN